MFWITLNKTGLPITDSPVSLCVYERGCYFIHHRNHFVNRRHYNPKELVGYWRRWYGGLLYVVGYYQQMPERWPCLSPA